VSSEGSDISADEDEANMDCLEASFINDDTELSQAARGTNYYHFIEYSFINYDADLSQTARGTNYYRFI